jgi:predicted Zn-dependent protease
MADFFQVLNKQQMASNSGGVPTFLSTHPDPADRYERVHQLTEFWQDSIPLSSYSVNTNDYLRMIDGIVYGEDPRQGYVEGNTFYHPELRFKYPIPSGWRLQNMPSQVQMAPEDGSALMIFTLSQQKDLEQAAQQTMQDLNLEILDTKRATVNGMQAVATVSQQSSQNQQSGEQQTIKVLSYFIDYGGNIYIFHGVTSEAEFNGYFRLFESTMVNFDNLTDPSKLNVEPLRIRIKEVPRTSSVAEVFQYYNVPSEMHGDLALLNNQDLNDQITAGELIKIISK